MDRNWGNHNRNLIKIPERFLPRYGAESTLENEAFKRGQRSKYKFIPYWIKQNNRIKRDGVETPVDDFLD